MDDRLITKPLFSVFFFNLDSFTGRDMRPVVLVSGLWIYVVYVCWSGSRGGNVYFIYWLPTRAHANHRALCFHHSFDCSSFLIGL